MYVRPKQPVGDQRQEQGAFGQMPQGVTKTQSNASHEVSLYRARAVCGLAMKDKPSGLSEE